MNAAYELCEAATVVTWQQGSLPGQFYFLHGMLLQKVQPPFFF